MKNEEYTKSSSGIAVIQVLAALISNPLLFADNNYRFSINDFPEQFHKIVFGAIEHLARKGMQKIDYIDIDQFLKQYDIQYKVFVDNKGVEYIQQALKMYNPKKFDYYYNTLKKHSLINSLNSQGIDTSDIFDPEEVDPIKSAAMQERFDNMTINEIILKEETKIIMAKEVFGSSDDMVQSRMGDGILDLINELKETPEIGMPLMSSKLTTLYRGQRLGCVYLESAASGAGKTRRAVGEACHLAIPEYYDLDKKKWVKTNQKENVLLIETELTLSEIQTIALAYVSGVNESHILDGSYAPGEEERVIKAGKLILNSNLYMVEISNFDTDDIINVIKKYNQIHNCNYIFYDYISENLKMIAEGTRKAKIALRSDQVWLSLITNLKDCAKQLGVYIWTSTQLSGDYKNAKELDAGYLRSAKSLSDKVDVGTITMPVREMDQAVISTYCAKGFEIVPNFVISVYKLRRGSYQNIKVYIHYDRGTCRIHDCFVTDAQGKILPIADTNVEVLLEDTKTEKFEDAYSFDFDF